MNMETRFCIEYVNPKHPLRDNGSINVRYDRVLTLRQAEHDLTLILSFGAKILNLYMGNVVDGKTGEWSPIPMIVDKDDWFTTDWLKSLRPQTKKEWDKADKEYRDAAIYYLRSYCNPYKVKPILEWLEELGPKSHWKPSDEQMEVLNEVIRNQYLSTTEYNGLIALREQFKAL